jgi:hypothetical protein
MSVTHVALMIAQGEQFILVWSRHLQRFSRMSATVCIVWHPPSKVQRAFPGCREDHRCFRLVVKQPATPCNESLEMYQKHRWEPSDTKRLGSSSRLFASRAVPKRAKR